MFRQKLLSSRFFFGYDVDDDGIILVYLYGKCINLNIICKSVSLAIDFDGKKGNFKQV